MIIKISSVQFWDGSNPSRTMEVNLHFKARGPSPVFPTAEKKNAESFRLSVLGKPGKRTKTRFRRVRGSHFRNGIGRRFPKVWIWRVPREGKRGASLFEQHTRDYRANMSLNYASRPISRFENSPQNIPSRIFCIFEDAIGLKCTMMDDSSLKIALYLSNCSMTRKICIR